MKIFYLTAFTVFTLTLSFSNHAEPRTKQGFAHLVQGPNHSLLTPAPRTMRHASPKGPSNFYKKIAKKAMPKARVKK
jgi:hypothetical protein